MPPKHRPSLISVLNADFTEIPRYSSVVYEPAGAYLVEKKLSLNLSVFKGKTVSQPGHWDLPINPQLSRSYKDVSKPMSTK